MTEGFPPSRLYDVNIQGFYTAAEPLLFNRGASAFRANLHPGFRPVFSSRLSAGVRREIWRGALVHGRCTL